MIASIAPNAAFAVVRALFRRKTGTIVELFQTQQNRHWFTEDTFLSLMRLRGVESGAPDGYAEAFYSRKTVLAV